MLLLDELHVDHLQHMPSPCPFSPLGDHGTGLVLKVVNFSMNERPPSRQLLGYRTHLTSASIPLRAADRLRSTPVVPLWFGRKTSFFLDPLGAGKTHLAKAPGLAAIAKQATHVKFTTVAAMVASLSQALNAGSYPAYLPTCLRPSVLILDEIGFLPPRTAQANLLFKVVSPRYDQGSIILTPNKSYAWRAEIVPGDEVTGTTVLDRLLRHATTITIKGQSLPPQRHAEGRFHREENGGKRGGMTLGGSRFQWVNGVRFQAALAAVDAPEAQSRVTAQARSASVPAAMRWTTASTNMAFTCWSTRAG
jgi:hypothetical protein